MWRYSLALENTVGMGAYGLQCASSFVQLLTLAVGGWGVEYSVVTVLPSHGLNPGNTVHHNDKSQVWFSSMGHHAYLILPLGW